MSRHISAFVCDFLFFSSSFFEQVLFLELAVTNQVWDCSYSRGISGEGCHFCVCTARVCVCVDVCVCMRRWVQEDVWTTILILNHPFVSVFIHVCKLWTIAGISTRGHYATPSMAFFFLFFLKGTRQGCHLWLLWPVGAQDSVRNRNWDLLHG